LLLWRNVNATGRQRYVPIIDFVPAGYVEITSFMAGTVKQPLLDVAEVVFGLRVLTQITTGDIVVQSCRTLYLKLTEVMK
jgi:hypothetical protein